MSFVIRSVYGIVIASLLLMSVATDGVAQDSRLAEEEIPIAVNSLLNGGLVRERIAAVQTLLDLTTVAYGLQTQVNAALRPLVDSTVFRAVYGEGIDLGTVNHQWVANLMILVATQPVFRYFVTKLFSDNRFPDFYKQILERNAVELEGPALMLYAAGLRLNDPTVTDTIKTDLEAWRLQRKDMGIGSDAAFSHVPKRLLTWQGDVVEVLLSLFRDNMSATSGPERSAELIYVRSVGSAFREQMRRSGIAADARKLVRAWADIVVRVSTLAQLYSRELADIRRARPEFHGDGGDGRGPRAFVSDFPEDGVPLQFIEELFLTIGQSVLDPFYVYYFADFAVVLGNNATVYFLQAVIRNFSADTAVGFFARRLASEILLKPEDRRPISSPKTVTSTEAIVEIMRRLRDTESVGVEAAAKQPLILATFLPPNTPLGNRVIEQALDPLRTGSMAHLESAARAFAGVKLVP